MRSGDDKEGWNSIDIFGMQIKVDFLCATRSWDAVVLDLALFGSPTTPPAQPRVWVGESDASRGSGREGGI